jgi:hypothetical protein
MKKRLIHPKWLSLGLPIIVIFGLFWKEIQSPLSETGHTFAEVGLVIILFGLVNIWLNTNQATTLADEWEEYTNKSIHH